MLKDPVEGVRRDWEMRDSEKFTRITCSISASIKNENDIRRINTFELSGVLSATCQHLDSTFNLYLWKMLTLTIPTDGTDSGYYTAGRSFKSGSGAPKKLHIFNSTLSLHPPLTPRGISMRFKYSISSATCNICPSCATSHKGVASV